MTKATGIGSGHGVPRRCGASHEWDGPEHVRCVLNFGPDHPMAQQAISELSQPFPIHQDDLGRRWTILGPYPPGKAT